MLVENAFDYPHYCRECGKLTSRGFNEEEKNPSSYRWGAVHSECAHLHIDCDGNLGSETQVCPHKPGEVRLAEPRYPIKQRGLTTLCEALGVTPVTDGRATILGYDIRVGDRWHPEFVEKALYEIRVRLETAEGPQRGAMISWCKMMIPHNRFMRLCRMIDKGTTKFGYADWEDIILYMAWQDKAWIGGNLCEVVKGEDRTLRVIAG